MFSDFFRLIKTPAKKSYIDEPIMPIKVIEEIQDTITIEEKREYLQNLSSKLRNNFLIVDEVNNNIYRVKCNYNNHFLNISNNIHISGDIYSFEVVTRNSNKTIFDYDYSIKIPNTSSVNITSDIINEYYDKAINSQFVKCNIKVIDEVRSDSNYIDICLKLDSSYGYEL